MSTASDYRTEPDHTLTKMPPGIPYIVGNEGAERFSFYGMKAILLVFMTTYLADSAGNKATMDPNVAQGWYYQFTSAVYYMPILGALLADGFLGRYRTILYLSIVYCFGHFALALDTTRMGLLIGLSLIALGAGGIKPCVSANVGDQFGRGNAHLLSKAFGWFYLSINFASGISIYVCPILLEHKDYGPHYAFGLPGVLMVIATIVFWLGRRKMVHVPPGGTAGLKAMFSGDGLKVLLNLAKVYVFIAIFWALWEQSSGGSWTLQAKAMDLQIFGTTLLPAQVQVVNGPFILLFIPLCNYVLYPLVERFLPLTPLRKIGIGLFVTAASYVVIWYVQVQIDGGAKPSVWWHMLAYAIISLGEVMVSVTSLEFSYTQAPSHMKSAVMALWLFAISMGSQVASWINFSIPKLQANGINLTGANYFAFFIGLMLLAGVIYIFVARRYHGRDYVLNPETT
ncbi:MAG: POT family MFS transporter [Verrucomicrobia bacterium]|nr:POT family MFS transporter [Verrucomicrobiota bacterium]